VDKVESIVFRKHDVPKGQININAENGVVYLRGQVDRPRARRDARGARAQGARREGVENLLHTSEPPA
jgi:osmotically-inducible protein OsmY